VQKVLIAAALALGLSLPIVGASGASETPAGAARTCAAVPYFHRGTKLIWRWEHRHGRRVRVHVRVRYARLEHRMVCQTVPTTPTTTPATPTSSAPTTTTTTLPGTVDVSPVFTTLISPGGTDYTVTVSLDTSALPSSSDFCPTLGYLSYNQFISIAVNLMNSTAPVSCSASTFDVAPNSQVSSAIEQSVELDYSGASYTDTAGQTVTISGDLLSLSLP